MKHLFSWLWSMFSRSSEPHIKWPTLEERNDLKRLLEASHNKPQLIFKHSPRCSISSLAKKEMRELYQMVEAGDLELELHMVDVVHARDVSNFVRETFDVRHESPQYLLIYRGNLINHDSHMGVQSQEVIKTVEQHIN